MKVSRHDYSGKSVFIGIDVHKKRSVISALCDGSVVKKWSTESDSVSTAEQINKFFSGASIFSAYEAGFSGFSLHRVLIKSGIKNIVVNPASIEIKSNDRVKTDKRDAKKIAEQLAAKRLHGIYIPSEEEEAKRSISRGREQAVQRRTKIGNQFKMKLHYLGICMPEGKKVGEPLFKWFSKQSIKFQEHQFYLQELISAWRDETARIKRFNNELIDQANKDANEKTYRSVPGVGAVSSRLLSNELGDLQRFDNVRQLSSYTGLTPSEFSTGEHIRKGHITRQGSARVRGILIEIAWRAIKIDKELFSLYQQISHRREGKRAIVAVARKILIRIRACFHQNQEWVIS